MLELSLSLVAAFAAFTAYVIAGDEIHAKRLSRQGISKKSANVIVAKGEKASGARTPKKTAKPKASAGKARTIKTGKTADSIATTSNAILEYLSANGAVTITKLAKELKKDKVTVLSAAEKLISEKSALAVKRGGYPAIAPNVH